MILITGAHKAFALYKAIEEGVNHMWTVSAFQNHPATLMITDEDATLELRVKTVKYFKVRFHHYTITHSIALGDACWFFNQVFLGSLEFIYLTFNSLKIYDIFYNFIFESLKNSFGAQN